MNKFKEILNTVVGDLNVLPVLHSCDAYSFRSIIESNVISISMCDVFNEKLLYAFYGIPSYRKNTERATKLMPNFPVCFILNFNNLNVFDKLYPFDTGAFFKIKSIKADYFHENMDIDDFELEPSVESAVKVVKKFYLKNKKYLDNDPVVKVNDFDVMDYEVRSYAALISAENNSDYDNRVSTVEVIFRNNIVLSKDSLMQVIIPNSFLDDQVISDKLKKEYFIKDPMGYHTIRGNSVEYFGVVYNKYYDYIINQGLI